MKKSITFSFLFLMFVVALPVAVHAATLGSTLSQVSSIINTLIKLILALAILYFFYGTASYMLHAGDEGKRKEAISTMIYGIIAIFVMVSIWGIIAILQNTFQVGGTTPSIPTIPTINQRTIAMPHVASVEELVHG